MKKYLLSLIAIFIFGFGFSSCSFAQSNSGLKIVFIRHGEKLENGDNLTCRGLNRALQLPAVIEHKFGVPDFTYVPSLGMKDRTSHARMFETVTPLAVKDNLTINSGFEETDYKGMASDLIRKKGVILVVWEHKAITGILQALGVNNAPTWSGGDFDSIWIVTFSNGTATLSKDSEGLNPSDNCP